MKNISAGLWPAQGPYLGVIAEVCYDFDASRSHYGVVVRDDTVEPGRLVILTRDDAGRCRAVLSTECQWRPVSWGREPGFL